MTVLAIPGGERDVLRVFQVRLPDATLAAWRGEGQEDEAIAARLLGVPADRARWLMLVPIRDLGDWPLSSFLAETEGLTEDRIAPDADRLDALTGTVLLARSGAFAGLETIDLGDRLALVSTLAPAQALRDTDPLPSAGALGQTSGDAGPGRPSDARMMGLVATVALLVMFAVAALVVWVGG